MPEVGLEPTRGITPRDFKSLASTSSATQAYDRSRVYLRGRSVSNWLESEYASGKQHVPRDGLCEKGVCKKGPAKGMVDGNTP